VGASFVDTIATQTMNLDLTQSIGPKRDIAGLCTDLFLIVIRMRESENLGEPSALRKLISYYLDLFAKNCKAISLDDTTIRIAQYGLVALVDETVLSIPGSCRDFWITHPLQLDLFGDNLAGEEFYNKLKKLMLEPEKNKDILEIYYLCLSLGFEGKYKIANAEERISIIADLGRKLRRTKKRLSTGLSPHGRRGDVVPVTTKNTFKFIPLWIIGLTGTVVPLIFWLIFVFLNNGHLAKTIQLLKPFVIN